MKKHLVLFVFAAFVSSSAQAAIGAPGLQINGFYGVNNSKREEEPQQVSLKSKFGTTYGGTIEFGMAPMISLETGVFFHQAKNDVTYLGIGWTAEQDTMEVPLMFRLHLLPIVDFGIGGFWERGDDQTTISASTNPAAVANGTTVGNKFVTYGPKVGVRARIPLLPTLGFLVDASYRMGLRDADADPAVSVKHKAYALLGGLSLSF